jgi:protein-tyrosine phosphatase
VIDLHCHILPGVDDGAADIEDAVAMAEQAAADGIAAICATPHIRDDHDVRPPELAERVASLNAELAGRNVGVSILTGAEVAETALGGLNPEELGSVALGGGRWVLLEPAPGPLSVSLLAAVRELAGHGHGAIIAHPERHFGERAPELLRDLVRDGALIQATAAFFEGAETSPLHDLASRGLVHVLGSDSHSARVGRPARLSAGLDALSRVPGMRRHMDWVAEDAPAAITEGRKVMPPFPPL